jgi:hypothetical protein|nr:hypothetical protein [Kofleriaceae bacterium]
MGFEFAEQMTGSIEWDDKPGVKYPFRFEVRAHARSLRDHAMTGRAELDGIVHAPPHVTAAEATGTILIRPIGGRVIRYELAFRGADGQRYEMHGQKDISFRHPFRTFTELPAEILDEDGHRVATCMTRFDLRHDGFTFLRSFRLV